MSNDEATIGPIDYQQGTSAKGDAKVLGGWKAAASQIGARERRGRRIIK
jgi:hypothetical protein